MSSEGEASSHPKAIACRLVAVVRLGAARSENREGDSVLEAEMAAVITQFGVAGLIGWMWMTERRASVQREKQISELHDRILRERTELDVLVTALKENTRALTALETGQRGLVALLGRVLPGRREQAEA